MREIKFRAWDKEGDYGMIKVFSIDWKHSGELNFFSGGKRIYRDGMENYILMQYTGLKDAKNREIYEGDIVVINKNKNLKGRYKVFWSTSGWSPFKNKITCCRGNPNCEIIGNIYNNPKLLKEA